MMKKKKTCTVVACGERESITKSKHVLVWKLLLHIFAHLGLGAFSRLFLTGSYKTDSSYIYI